jgi:predicted GIY-YIG superfamily endonuclease
MSDDLNFSTQYYPLVNKLKEWVSDYFYPYIKKMNQRSDTFRIYRLSSNNGCLDISKNDGENISSFDLIIEELEHFNNKAGIYGICINANNQAAFIYTGKSKNLSNRVRQHLTGKNLNGEAIAETTKHKHSDICTLVTQNNIEVSFFVWTNKKLTESSAIDYELGILEALFIAKSKCDFLTMNTHQNLSLCHWNLRIG